jgi:hypothetical protein
MYGGEKSSFGEHRKKETKEQRRKCTYIVGNISRVRVHLKLVLKMENKRL